MTPAQQQREIELLNFIRQRRMARMVLAGWSFENDGTWWKAYVPGGAVYLAGMAFLDCLDQAWKVAVERGDIYGTGECVK